MPRKQEGTAARGGKLEEARGDRSITKSLSEPTATCTTAATPVRRRWWHVPDEQIEALVQAARRPGDAVASSDNGQGSALRSSRRQSVHFGHEDALDQMMRRTLEARGQQVLEERPAKWWRVPDERIEQMVSEMSKPAAKLDRTLASAGASTLGALAGGLSSPQTRHALGQRDCNKVTLQLVLPESGGELELRVPRDLRTGPAKARPANRFTDVFGQGAASNGFDPSIRSVEYRCRWSGSTQEELWTVARAASLKGLIEQATDIEPSRQKLEFRSGKMNFDDMTLASYGVQDGDMIFLHAQNWASVSGVKKDVVLACTRRKEAAQVKRRQAAAMPSLADCDYRQRPDGSIQRMPRWISQSNPELFAHVGIGVDGDGGHKVRTDFGSMPIYLQDAQDSRISRVREVVTGHAQYLRQR